MAAYARSLAARRRRPEPQKVTEVLGLAPVLRSQQSTPGCTLVTVADNGTTGLEDKDLPDRGWTLHKPRIRGLNGDVIPQPGWTAAVSLLLGENFVARQAEDLELALSTAGDCAAVYAHGHNASLAVTYAAARNPQRAAWILHEGFITYRHFIDRPEQAAKSFELKAEDRDRTTSFDREIPFAYFPFGALRYFDLPDLLGAARRVLILNPIDGDWKPLAEAEAKRWLPSNVRLHVERDPASTVRIVRTHLDEQRANSADK
jgi:hypothetical protein